MRAPIWLVAGACLLGITARPAWGEDTHIDCATALQPRDDFQEGRKLTAQDLVGLRDIGASFDTPVWARSVPADAAAIALSPDGHALAFEMRRAMPQINGFCLGIFVLDLKPGAEPLQIDQGGELIRAQFEFRGKAGYPTGDVVDRQLRWAPDGSRVFFLKQLKGPVQVWQAHVDGSGSKPVTQSPDDIQDFRLAADGRSVVFKTQPGLRLGLDALAAEAREGFHYDERFSPMASNRPFVRGPLPYQTWIQPSTLDTAPQKATSSEEALFEVNSGIPTGAVAGASSLHGDLAWILLDEAHYPPRLTVQARMAGKSVIVCTAPSCGDNIMQIWWTPDGRLRFLRQEGWDREATAIYEWRPGKDQPRRIFLTNDVLTSCVANPTGLFCLREKSLRPRYIARIDLPSGRETQLFDPNPEFLAAQLGQVERLHWRNAQGLQAFGDLVLPTDYKPGQRYPLIIVQYQSRGFLRGGTDDEYPIQLFAAHGFAVLSFNRPTNIGFAGQARTLAEAQRANDKDYADRRSVQSALEEGIRLLFDRGIVDPQRIGITGLSDGASTVNFALINSALFKAAAFSSCCWDSSMAISVGPGAMSHFAATYPSVLSDDLPIWDPISIAKNAGHLNVPMLLQLSDSEYMSGLTAYTALRDHHQPADMYVFPDEYHAKWQSAHRLAIYRRDLAWFQFWLGSDEPIDISPAELERWRDRRRESAANDCAPTTRANDRSMPQPPAVPARGSDQGPNRDGHCSAAAQEPVGQ